MPKGKVSKATQEAGIGESLINDNEDPNIKIQRDLVATYKFLFASAPGKIIMRDLAHFCFRSETTWQGDKDVMLLNEGRRSVIIYIENMTGLDLSLFDNKDE